MPDDFPVTTLDSDFEKATVLPLVADNEINLRSHLLKSKVRQRACVCYVESSEVRNLTEFNRHSLPIVSGMTGKSGAIYSFISNPIANKQCNMARIM